MRRWIKRLLIILCVASIIVLISDVEDLKIFITSHIIAGIVFVFTSNLLLERKY